MTIFDSIAKRMGYSKPAAPKKQAMMMRQYAAARIDRTTNDWVTAPTSANEELRQGGLAIIRDRARQLERDDDLFRKYLSMVEANIVGRGFVLKIDSPDAEARTIETAFQDWLSKADISGKLSAADLQRLLVRTVARDGEAFTRVFIGAQYYHGIGIQVIESDYVDHNFTQLNNDDTAWVMGVHVDKYGRELGYWTYNKHPGDYTRTSNGATAQEVKAENMIHIYRMERPGQTRAVSWGASAMQSLKMLRGYQEAELIAARICASKMGFYKVPPSESFDADGHTEQGAPVTDASPGQFETMPTGWEFQSFDPQHPTSQYGQFVKDMIRGISGGLEVAYNNLASDLEGVSYSSIRQGTQEEREGWICKQSWFSGDAMRKLYRVWLPIAVTSGAVRLPSSAVQKYLERDLWTGRRWPWVDPLNDIETKKKEIEMGLTSPSEIAAENGRDYRKVQAQIAEDNNVRAANDLPSVSVMPADGAQITGISSLVSQAAQGLIPVASVGPMLAASYPSMTQDEIDAIVKPLTNFRPNTGI